MTEKKTDFITTNKVCNVFCTDGWIS